MNLKELLQKRDDHITSFFWLALHIAFIFLIPAVSAALLGNKINEWYSIKGMEFLLLFFAFVFSWWLIAREYTKKTKVMRELDEQIKKAREDEAKELIK